MKDLINNIVAFLRAAVGTSELDANIIIKGFDEAEIDQLPDESFPYVAIDDGGESVDTAEVGGMTQQRLYNVEFFMAVLSANYEDSLDAILDLANQVKTLLEKEANRQKDGHIWGINITPVVGTIGDTNYMFRGRQITVQYTELEDNYGEY